MATAADGRSSMHPTGMHSFLVFETEPLGLDAQCPILDRGRGLHILMKQFSFYQLNVLILNTISK